MTKPKKNKRIGAWAVIRDGHIQNFNPTQSPILFFAGGLSLAIFRKRKSIPHNNLEGAIEIKKVEIIIKNK